MQYVKCGFAGENFPTSVFPCVVGRPLLRYEESLIEQELKVCDFHVFYEFFSGCDKGNAGMIVCQWLGNLTFNPFDTYDCIFYSEKQFDVLISWIL